MRKLLCCGEEKRHVGISVTHDVGLVLRLQVIILQVTIFQLLLGDASHR
jgi:hypothetical protein